MSENQSLSRLRLLLMVGSCLLAGWGLQANADFCRSTFGRADLLWVSVLSTLPFSLWLGVVASNKTTMFGVAGGLSLFGFLLWSILLSSSSTESPLALVTLGQLALQTSLAGLLVLIQGVRSQEISRSIASGLATLVLALVTPMVYSSQVASQLEKSLEESFAGQRVNRSLELVESLQAIRPEMNFQNQSLDELQAILGNQQTRLVQFLTSSAAARQPGQRVIALMQLDRYLEALQLLKPMIDQPQAAPISLDYAGLCQQRLKNWEESRDAYSSARDYWKSESASPRRTEALLSAYRGIAFAERQLDHPHAAEDAYLSALELSPSADIHFLLARLYEGEQRTNAAREQIQAAIQLAPEQYSDSGQKLLNKMSMSHFGCFQLAGELTSETTP